MNYKDSIQQARQNRNAKPTAVTGTPVGGKPTDAESIPFVPPAEEEIKPHIHSFVNDVCACGEKDD